MPPKTISLSSNDRCLLNKAICKDNNVTVNGEPVSSTNPLPVEITNSGGGSGGDASASNQETQISQLSTIVDNTSDSAKDTTLQSLLSSSEDQLTALQTGIVVASSPLPTNASTASNQVTGNNSLSSIDSKTPSLIGGRVPVDGSSVTQPVSAAILPLPTGAATSSNQTIGNTSLNSIDTKTPSLISGRVPVDGSAVTQPVSVSALPLPAGASTAANQTSGNASLSSIDGKTPGLGQSTSIGSSPVVIASDQSTIKTKLATDIAPISGTITTSTSVISASNLSGVGAVTVSIYGTYAGVNVTFEIFDGVNWVVIFAQPTNTATPILVSTTGVLTSNSTNTWNISPILGAQQFRVRATAYTSGTANVLIIPSAQFTQYLVNVGSMPTTTITGTVTANLGTGGTAATSLGKAEDAASVSGDTGVMILGVRRDTPTTSSSATGDYNEIAVDQWGSQLYRKYGTQRKTYSAAFQFVPAASATDVVEIIGSGTATIQIIKVSISGTQTTGKTVNTSLVRRSTTATGGTSTTATTVAHETSDTASTATIKYYTANPTALGTTIGTIKSRQVNVPSNSSTPQVAEYYWGENSKPVILSGVTQSLCLNFGGSTLSGGLIDVEIEYTEI